MVISDTVLSERHLQASPTGWITKQEVSTGLVVPWIMRAYVRGIRRSRGSRAVLTEDSVEKFPAPPHTSALKGKRRCVPGLHRRRAFSAALRLINIPFKQLFSYLVTSSHTQKHCGVLRREVKLLISIPLKDRPKVPLPHRVILFFVFFFSMRTIAKHKQHYFSHILREMPQRVITQSFLPSSLLSLEVNWKN